MPKIIQLFIPIVVYLLVSKYCSGRRTLESSVDIMNVEILQASKGGRKRGQRGIENSKQDQGK
jgi:hypothetical protein